MRIDGEWLECLDGDTRPIIRAEILLDDGNWFEFSLLVDTGADRTVLSADVLRASHLRLAGDLRPIGGLGGIVACEIVKTQLRFRRDDGVQVAVRGEFAALIEPEALDMSVLGRDVLDMFALIVDRSHDVVAILGGQHRYNITRTS